MFKHKCATSEYVLDILKDSILKLLRHKPDLNFHFYDTSNKLNF